ncbi:MAG: hypothetical protein ACRD0G_18855 [Acidimicrobiales bacterium]
MATETVILTALPNGRYPDGRLRLTAFVSPRLSTDGPPELPLKAFPAFADWPAALAQLKLVAEFDSTGPVPTDPDLDSDPPDSAIWKLVFDAEAVAVRTGGFRDLSTRRVLTFPATEIAGQILDLYGTVATTSPTELPPITTGPLADLPDRVSLGGRRKDALYGQLDGLIAEEQGPEEKEPGQGRKSGRYLDRSLLSAAQRRRLAWVQAYRFYDRPGSRDPLGPNVVPPEPDAPRIDFHGYVASLGDYPLLLRRLGLAVDLLADAPANLKATGTVRLLVDAGDPGVAFAESNEARPFTHYELRDRRFLPRPRNVEGPFADGTLRLEHKGFFAVHQLDVDGSAIKTVDFAGNVERLAAHLLSGERSMSKDEAALPALRTGGFVVTHDDRAKTVVDQFDTAVSHEDDHAHTTPVELFAEDVTRGLRPDVETDGGRWLPLCAREGTYVVTRGGVERPIDIDRDEGFVKGSSTTSVPGDDDLYLHEAAFGWDGWSLVAKRPGQAIVDNEGDELGQPPPKPPDDFPLVTAFKPDKGSLPRLRFGTTYRFRARLVDLAGNSVHEAALEDHVSPPHAFRRFDPVPSPAVVPRRPFTEGESLLRMVVRSTLGLTPSAYVGQNRIQTLSGHSAPLTAYLDANERHLAAPKTSVQLAEWHTLFDAAIGANASQAAIDAQFTIASRESGSFLEPGPDVVVVNPNPNAVPTDLADPDRRRGDPLQQGEYVCHSTEDLALPYLPDVLSAGASFTTLPGDADTRTEAWIGGDWPDRQPMRIRIEDGGLTTDPQTPPHWDPATRLLTVFLRQAELVTVRLSSFPDPARLQELGIWMLEPEPTRTAQQADADAGRHWMLTPYQELTLVHAVEKPLTAPLVDVDDSGVQRNEGETFAVLSGTIANHAKSTGRLDIEAAWTEPVDDLARPGPSDLEGQAHVGDFTLEATEDACRVGRHDAAAVGTAPAVHRLRHEFRDTKHRVVRYKAVATTRFREYFPPEITNEPELVTHEGPEKELIVRSSRRPNPPEVLYVVPTFSWGEERFRALLPDVPLSELPASVAEAIRALPGGARRAARNLPRLAAELPATVRLPSVVRRTRRAGLRVYLDRPWYSSGAGELLGVVVPDQVYLPWPLDLGRSVVVDALERARADELAERILATGAVKGAGPARLSPSERLARGVQKLAPKAGAEAEAIARAGDAAVLFSAFQSDLVAGLLADLGGFFATGDPEEYVTRWGKDPIWGSDAPASGPWIHQFPLRSAVGTGLSLSEAPGHTVAVVGHRPEYDADRRLWYCDVDIDAGTSYWPFVRLGLARYQRHSIPGVHLSRVVTPEWTQLVADRTATVTRLGGGRARVTLRGPGGFTDLAERVLGSAAKGPQGMALSRFAVAQVERLPEEATTDLAWVPVGEEVRLDLDVVQAYRDVRYRGAVPVPRKARGEQLRLAVREYEILETDLTQADSVVEHTVFVDAIVTPGGVTLVREDDDRGVRYRMVYADHLPL